MKISKFSLIIIIFSVLVVVLGIAVGIKVLNTEPEIIEKKSDEYIYYDERFNFKLSEDKSYYIITRFDPANTETKAEIPDTIDGIPVKKILNDNNDFASWNNCISIRIGKNVEYIGSEKDNDGIKNGGTYGDGFLLNSNSKTTTIIVDEANEVYSSRDGVLYNKDKTILLKYPNSKITDFETFNVVIPDSVVKIYNYAFYANRNIQSLVLGKNVEEIGNFAFSDCEKLATIKFNDKLTTIGVAAFRDCALTSVTLPDSVETLNNLAFGYNSSLSYCYVAANCKSFGNGIFNGVDKAFVLYTTEENLPFLKEVESLKEYSKKSN